MPSTASLISRLVDGQVYEVGLMLVDVVSQVNASEHDLGPEASVSVSTYEMPAPMPTTLMRLQSVLAGCSQIV